MMKYLIFFMVIMSFALKLIRSFSLIGYVKIIIYYEKNFI